MQKCAREATSDEHRAHESHELHERVHAGGWRSGLQRRPLVVHFSMEDENLPVDWNDWNYDNP